MTDDDLREKLQPEGAPAWVVMFLSTMLAVAALLAAMALLFSEIGITLIHQWRHLKGVISDDVAHVEVWGIWRAIGAFGALGVGSFAFAAGIPGSVAQKFILAVVERITGKSVRPEDGGDD